MTPTLAVGAVVLTDTSDKVLLIKRARPPLQGTWTLPGGRVRGGERLVDAVRREVREETGLDVQTRSMLEVVELVTEGYHYVIIDFLCCAHEITPIPADDAVDATWAEVGQLSRFDLTTDVLSVIRKGQRMA